MHRVTRLLLILTVLGLMGQPLRAQEIDLTDTRTPEQKWRRMIYMTNFMVTGLVDMGQSLGKTPEEIGEWLGEYSARSWGGPGSITLPRFVRQTFLNHNLWPELEFEILSETEGEIRFRTNMPWAGFFGEDRMRYGVNMDDYSAVMAIMHEGIAESVGFNMTYKVEGGWIEYSLKTH